MRFVIFAPSIVSNVDNPVAAPLRDVVVDLMSRGHEVTVWEERRNPAMQRSLKRDGAQDLRDFQANYPQIDYRTYEMPPRHETAVWLSFRAAIADCVIGFEEIPPLLWQSMIDFDSTPTVRLIASVAPDGTIVATDSLTNLPSPFVASQAESMVNIKRRKRV